MTPTKIEDLTAHGFQGVRFAFDSKRLAEPVHFCRFRPDGLADASACAGTLYVFHGGNGDDRQTHQAGLVSNLKPTQLEALKNARVQIVTPFIGKTFLSTSPVAPSYSDYFFQELMPSAETGTRTGPASRWISGFSMGGQAALNAFLRFPSLFTGVGALFPTLVNFDLADAAQTASYCSRTGSKPEVVELLAQEFRAAFPDREHFKKHDPFALVQKLPTGALDGKKLFLEVGDRDMFGLFEGVRQFRKLLLDRSIDHAYQEIKGGEHDAKFLNERFPEMLKFFFEST